MATVNGRKITRTDVQKFYDAQVAGSPQQPSAEQADTLRLKILSDLIDNEILMQRAEKLGLLATDEEVNAKLTEIKAPFTQEQFDQRLKERQITLDDFKKDLRRSLTIDKVLNKEVTSKINVTDDDITNYYNQHKAEFNLIEPQYHLAQILVTTQPNPQVKNMKAQNEAEARKKMQMVQNRLDSGEDFATVAMSYSEQPETAQNGGDLGFIPESSLKTDKIGLRRHQQAQAGTVHCRLAGARSQRQADLRIPHRQADQPGSGGPARAERSPRATGHSRTAARPPRAVAEGGLLRDHSRPGQDRQLFRRRHPEAGRNLEVRGSE